MAGKNFIVELEERLDADHNGELRQKLVVQLETLHASLIASRRKLSERELYRRTQAALDAVEAAIAVLRKSCLRKE